MPEWSPTAALGGLVPGGGRPRRGSETRNQWPELLERPPGRARAEPWSASVSF